MEKPNSSALANFLVEPDSGFGSAILVRSTRNLHLIVEVDEKANQYAIVCEAEPLMTLRSYGVPKRCPVCQQENPIRGEKKRGIEI